MVRQLSFTCSIMMTFVTLIFSSQKPSDTEYLLCYNKLVIIKNEPKKNTAHLAKVSTSSITAEDQKILGLTDLSEVEQAAAFALSSIQKEEQFTSSPAQKNATIEPTGTKKTLQTKPTQLIMKLYKASSKSLLSIDPDNSKKIYLLYPLHEAVRLGFVDCAEYLIEQGAPADAYNHVGKIPLHIACTINDENTAIKLATMLIGAGCDTNKPTRLGDTALYYAAIYKKWELVRSLIRRGAYDNPGPLLSVIPHLKVMPDTELCSTLIELLQENKIKARVKQARSLVSDNDLYRVLRKRDYKRAQLFIEHGIGDNQGPGGSVLPFIIDMDDQELAKSFLISLIAHNADPNFLIQDNNLLYHAVAQQKYVIAKSLLTMGAVDNTGPGGSVEHGIALSNDSDLITLFKIRKDLPAPQFFERTQDLSPRH